MTFPEQNLSKVDQVEFSWALDQEDIPRSCVGSATPYPVLTQQYHPYPETCPNYADKVCQSVIVVWMTVSWSDCLTSPTSLPGLRAFPFLIMGKMQLLHFTSSEERRDCKGYNEIFSRFKYSIFFPF